MNRSFTFFLLIIFLVVFYSNKLDAATTNDLPECVVITHCVRENFKVKDLENAFKKATEIVSDTPRTKIIEQANLYIHAEAKTKWRRYTDDFLILGIPEKGIIQVRSESRVGIGDNGVNKNRVEDFAYRLMSNQDIAN